MIDDHTSLRLAGFGIDDGHRFLRGSGLAAGSDTGSLHGRHRTVCRSSFGYHIHDAANDARLFPGQHLAEHFGRAVSFNLWLHQLAFEVGRRGNNQRHLERRHL